MCSSLNIWSLFISNKRANSNMMAKNHIEDKEQDHIEAISSNNINSKKKYAQETVFGSEKLMQYCSHYPQYYYIKFIQHTNSFISLTSMSLTWIATLATDLSGGKLASCGGTLRIDLITHITNFGRTCIAFQNVCVSSPTQKCVAVLLYLVRAPLC